MMNPPEPIHDKATPEQLIRRLDIFRERYKHGLMTAAEFNEVLKLFQFTDDLGHIWSPGATTNQWYSWNLNEWTPAQPPPLLTVPDMDLTKSPMWKVASASSKAQVTFNQPDQQTLSQQYQQQVVHAPPERRCPKCSNIVAGGKKFCTTCGTRV